MIDKPISKIEVIRRIPGKKISVGNLRHRYVSVFLLPIGTFFQDCRVLPASFPITSGPGVGPLLSLSHMTDMDSYHRTFPRKRRAFACIR